MWRRCLYNLAYTRENMRLIQVGDLIRQFRHPGRANLPIGIVTSVRVLKDSDFGDRQMIIAFWGVGHRMNDRYVSPVSVEVVSESR